MADRTNACTACGAKNPPSASWCGQCHAPFGAKPASPDIRVADRPTRRFDLARHGTTLIVLFFVVTQLVIPSIRDARAMGRVVQGVIQPEGYAFNGSDEETGEPVRYDACRPIYYTINPTLAPPGGVEDVHAAFAATAEASGLSFVYDGPTGEPVDFDRANYQPDRYGQRWVPILVGWSEDIQSIDLGEPPTGGKRLGIGGSRFTTNDEGRPVYVTGTIVFDASADLRSGYAGRTWGQVMLHEVGHVVGLGHTNHPDSLMNPTLQLRSAAWTGVDEAGLRKLGTSSPCLDAPPLP